MKYISLNNKHYYFFLVPQIHRYMSPNEGSNGLYGIPSQTHHCRGVGFHLCILYALAVPGGHPGEPWRSCSVWLPRLSRPLPAHLPDRLRHLLRDPAAPGHRSLRSHRPNPLPESSATSTKLRYHYRLHSQEELQRTSGCRKRGSSGTPKERAFFPETGACVCVQKLIPHFDTHWDCS